MVVHVIRPHVPPDLMVLVPQFQLLPLLVLIIYEIDGVVGQAVAIGRPLSPLLHLLQVMLEFKLLDGFTLLDHFPPFVLSFQLFYSLFLEFVLPLYFLLLPA